MKTIIRIFSLLVISLGVLFLQSTSAQSVMDPADPLVNYNSSAPPTQPAWGQIGKWVRTPLLNWTTTSYKAYIYKGFQFRLKFPKTYNPTANDGKKYPVFVFFHGLGETGTIYQNEKQLLHGGEYIRNKVDNGSFDGYLLYPQSGGFWGAGQYDLVKEILDYMIINNKVDPFQIVDNGLSAGGAATWEMLFRYPTYITASLPISDAQISYRDNANLVKYTPMWIFQGEVDGSPDAYTTKQIRDAILAVGGNFKYTEYAGQGHGVWNLAWAEPDFFPYINRAYASNPWTLFGRTEFCPLDPINVTIGLTAGFNQYEWRKNGVLIPGATTNTIQVSGASAVGIYSARVRRGTYWSDWSRTPVEIKIKAPTVPPTITVAGLMSKVIPALDGNTGVTLQVPTGYSSYLWQKVGNTTTIGIANTLNATTPGGYKVQVTEQYGCSTNFSDPFTVVDANGPNKPDPAINLIITTLSKTSLRLDWSDNPTPLYNETNFEIYRASQANGPFTLIAITNADVLTYTSAGLNSNTTYYYKVRAVNNTGAAAASNVANGTTASDTQAPTAPTNLAITGTTRSSISLSWTAATDDVAVTKYDVYINGLKAYVTTQTSFTVYNLLAGQTYNFSTRARDFANNVSPFSNQVTGQAILNGLPYKYYTYTGSWSNLPDFTTLTPVTTGIMPNVALTPRTQNDYFAFLWEGFINIPVTGTYYFRTNSDDGSRLWLGSLNGASSPYSFSGTPIVNNDGLHGTQDRTSVALSLTAGVYPIAMAFYEEGGGEAMTVSWRTPQTGSSYVTIPTSAFADAANIGGTVPANPSGLAATAVSYKRIDLGWTDNSNNESAFEIWRSTNSSTGFVTVGMAAANATSYIDSSLNASTTYYYKIRAIGQYGESQLVGSSNDIQANWKFNNNYTDASGNGKTLTPNNSPTFSTDFREGTHSVEMNGSDEDMDVNTSSGDYIRGGYTEKTIAFWMKSDNNGSIITTRGIVDLGGNDNGLALALNNSRLYAGVASGNTRRSINVNYSSTGWNHIALVYNASTLRLYVNAVQVVANTSLGFTAVGTTSDGSRIGDDNNNNALNSSFGQFDGKLDNFYIVGKALSVNDITSLMNNIPLTQSFATTFALPAIPLSPTGLLASGQSSSRININWNDVASETSFELYRSSNTNSNYLLFATLPSNTVSFIDSGLFANAVYYYKVRALNAGGPSGYSNEDSAKTINNLPVITAITDQYMRYGSLLNLNITASDIDPGSLSLQVNNLPSFASFTPGANGTGTISFNNPTIGQQGSYNNIGVTVTDAQGGNSSIFFNLIVNDNYVPVISNISNVAVNELQVSQVNIAATDQNAGEILTWSFTGLPSFATPVINGSSVQINLAPGYADNGPYTVTARVVDEHNGFDTASFVITVIDVNPNKRVYINFTDGTYTSPAPWNNTNKPTPSLNDDFVNFKDESGINTGIGIRITSPWQNLGNATNTYGVNTGNNSGVYPDNVMRSAYFTDASTQSMSVHGLNPAYKYKFTFFGSRNGVNDDRTSVYTIGGTSVTLNAASNSQNTVSVNNVQPNPDGTLPLTLQKTASALYGYLNAMVIQILYDDGTPPAKPRNLIGQFVSGAIKLNWIDAAYNEAAYEVYRSSSNLPGSFSLLNPGGNNANLQQYDDVNISGNITYYYYVRATNNNGNSPSSDTISVTSPNASPILNTIADVKMKTQQVVDVNIVATDDPSDIITLQVTGLPSFATFTATGTGTGTISIAPGNTMGTFTGITVIATDNKGAASSTPFKILVSNKDITSYFVNFNYVLPAGDPWNNFNTWPYAGSTITNLTDDGGNTTSIGVAL
ncbi:MAG: LamG-like jellyroll fold domain-containing protein, partial [Chitinophagaceae bacterium]